MLLVLLFVCEHCLFVCIVSGVGNRLLGSIKERTEAFQNNGKCRGGVCVCVCVCVVCVYM